MKGTATLIILTIQFLLHGHSNSFIHSTSIRNPPYIKNDSRKLFDFHFHLTTLRLPCHNYHSSTSLLSATHLDQYETRTYANTNELFEKLDELYTQSSIKIKCPFFRRRAADLIDSVAMISRFLLIRHKSLIGLFDPSVSTALPFLGKSSSSTKIREIDEDDFLGAMIPPGCRSMNNYGTFPSSRKCRGLNEREILNIIYKDWTRRKIKISNRGKSAHETSLNVLQDGQDHDVGYYITGTLNSTIYRDDCKFDGPDPDMPVRGLRKYLSAASKLFDHKSSYADLLDLRIVDVKDEENSLKGHRSKTRKAIEAKWRIGGVIMLPWKPEVKPYTGTTTYHIDKEGLIYFHEEKWDISVWEAFMNVLLPEMADKIWSSKYKVDSLMHDEIL